MKNYHVKIVYTLSLISGLVFFMLSVITAQRWALNYNNEQNFYYNPSLAISLDTDGRLLFTFLSAAFLILFLSLLFIGRMLSRSFKNQY